MSLSWCWYRKMEKAHGLRCWLAMDMEMVNEMLLVWAPNGSVLDEPGIHNRFAVELVKRGLLVVIPEIMGFGVRRMAEEIEANPNYSSCGTLSSQLLMFGRTLAGMRVYESCGRWITYNFGMMS